MDLPCGSGGRGNGMAVGRSDVVMTPTAALLLTVSLLYIGLRAAEIVRDVLDFRSRRSHP